jgi:hypothetical protein
MLTTEMGRQLWLAKHEISDGGRLRRAEAEGEQACGDAAERRHSHPARREGSRGG